MKSNVLFLLVFLCIQSCTDPEKRSESTTSSANYISVTDTAAKVFKGLYVNGKELNTLQECGSRERTYWVNDSLVNLKSRYDDTNRAPAYTNESVYVELKGYLTGKPGTGFASAYQNTLVVTEIIKVEAKNFRTDCYNYEFIAIGNEPFWSLDINPEEQKIILKDVGLNKSIEFNYAPANVGGGVHRYEATNAAMKKLVVVIREEKCSDGMSDRQYNYSAEVTLNGRMYKGCAIKKGDVFNDSP